VGRELSGKICSQQKAKVYDIQRAGFDFSGYIEGVKIRPSKQETNFINLNLGKKRHPKNKLEKKTKRRFEMPSYLWTGSRLLKTSRQ
jgi:hypothetical protein